MVGLVVYSSVDDIIDYIKEDDVNDNDDGDDDSGGRNGRDVC